MGRRLMRPYLLTVLTLTIGLAVVLLVIAGGGGAAVPVNIWGEVSA
jgi:hypothetical protein